MEAATINTLFYKEALIILSAAAIVIPLFHRLHVSSVLGFMLVGVVVGPFGLGSLAQQFPWLSVITIGEPQSINPIANLGVVLLLFMIGLELSLERLLVMRRLVFGLGFLQTVLCAAALAGIAVLLGCRPLSTVVIGLALAMSSTAVVIQVLSEERRLNTVVGRTSFAILLFQDLAVVPVLFVLGALGQTHNAGGIAGLRARHRSSDGGRHCHRRARPSGPAPVVSQCRPYAQRGALRSRMPVSSDRDRARHSGRRSVDGSRRVDRGSAAGRDRIPPPSRDHNRAVQRAVRRSISDLHWHDAGCPVDRSPSAIRFRRRRWHCAGETAGHRPLDAPLRYDLGERPADRPAPRPRRRICLCHRIRCGC